MKSLIVGLLCLVPSAALAYELPVHHKYCGESAELDRNGIHGEDESCVPSSAITGALVELTCTIETDVAPGTPKTYTSNMIILEDHPHKGQVTVTDADKGGAAIWDRCD